MNDLKGLPNDFDFQIYKCYEDLCNLDNQSLKIHYLSFGGIEGRIYKLPEGFTTKYYKKYNKDLKKLNDEQLIKHYINYGKNENRKYCKKSKMIEIPILPKNFIENALLNYKNGNKTTRNDIIIVIARYNEDISRFKIYNNNLMIYNKGNDDIHNEISQQNIKKVPNLGREAGTYCNFILDNYDNLPEYTIFLQGNPTDHVYMSDHTKTFELIDQIYNEPKNYKFKYISTHMEPFDLESVAHAGLGVYLTPIELGNPKDINELINDIDRWVNTHVPDQKERSNEVINQLRNLGLSHIWPWDFCRVLMKSIWYCTSGEAQIMRHEIVRDCFDYHKIKKLIDRPHGFSFGYGAMFIVHRDNILRYSKSYWQRLFDSLQELLPTAGWGCERLWGFLLGEGDFY